MGVILLRPGASTLNERCISKSFVDGRLGRITGNSDISLADNFVQVPNPSIAPTWPFRGGASSRARKSQGVRAGSRGPGETNISLGWPFPSPPSPAQMNSKIPYCRQYEQNTLFKSKANSHRAGVAILNMDTGVFQHATESLSTSRIDSGDHVYRQCTREG